MSGILGDSRFDTDLFELVRKLYSGRRAQFHDESNCLFTDMIFAH